MQAPAITKDFLAQHHLSNDEHKEMVMVVNL